MIGAETLWIMEKADGIYPRISRADRSPTWVWQGQPGVRARQICQRQADSCIAIPSLHPIPRHAVHEGHRAGPGLLAHTCAKENTRSQSSQGRKKCFGPHGKYGSHSIQWVHKTPPNSHLPNTPSKRMDTEATTLSPASWKIALSPLWEAVLRIHTYHNQPYQAFRDLPGICYYWTHGYTGNGHTKSIWSLQSIPIPGCETLPSCYGRLVWSKTVLNQPKHIYLRSGFLLLKDRDKEPHTAS